MKIYSQELSAGQPWSDDFTRIESVLSDIPLIPPTHEQLKTGLFSEQNPFWSRGKAKAFWITDEARLIGFYDPNIVIQGRPCFFFGYWISKNSPEASASLFQELMAWGRSLGLDQVVGPMNFKTFYDYRLRLDHFADPSFWGEPTNPDYFPELLALSGFKVIQTYVTDFIDDLDRIREIANKRLPRLYSESSDWSFDPINLETLLLQHSDLIALANNLFSINLGFQKIEDFDFHMIYNKRFLTQLCPKTSFLLRDQTGALHGLCLSFPHPSDPSCVLVKTIGVNSNTRNSGRTFAEFLHYIFKQSTGYKSMAFCLMTEDNLGHRLAAKYFQRRRTYGLFGKNL